jgi:hypothetical protein
VHSRGARNAPPNCVQLHCLRCGKISYWHQIEKRVLPGRRVGGTCVNDPYRPVCRKCANRNKNVSRCSFTKAELERRITRLPIRVRIRIKKWAWLGEIFRKAKSSEDVLRVYVCPHRQIYKTTDGKFVWKRKKGQRLNKTMTLRRAFGGRLEGRPVVQS